MKNRPLPGMKHALISLLLTGLIASVSDAQTGARPKPATPAKKGTSPLAVRLAGPAPGDKVVLRVGTGQVAEAEFNSLVEGLGSQVQQILAKQGRRPGGEQYALMLLLSQQAVSQKLDQTPEFRRRMAMQRNQWLAETEVHLESEIKITPEEVKQYYADRPGDFREVQVLQAVVRKRAEGAAEGTTGLAPQEARARATSIRSAVAAGREVRQVAQEFQSSNDILIPADPGLFVALSCRRKWRGWCSSPGMERQARFSRRRKPSSSFARLDSALWNSKMSHRRSKASFTWSECKPP